MKEITEKDWWGMDFYDTADARRFADMIRHRQNAGYDVRRKGSVVALRSWEGRKPWAVWEQIRSSVKPLGNGLEPKF